MAEQSFQSHAHRPRLAYAVWVFSLAALILILGQMVWDWSTRDWAIVAVIMAAFTLGWISRVYIIALQDRIIMLEEKVRAAELLPPGQDKQLAKLSKKQIAALRFASDDEFGSLLERAVREHLSPRDIKASIRTWRPDPHRT